MRPGTSSKAQHSVFCIAALLASAGWCTTGAAQYSTDFEAPAYAGSAAGTPLTGQQNWFIPIVGGIDFNVYTASGNALAIAPNPAGGDQFAASRSLGGVSYGRAQVPVDFSAGGLWEASWDVLAKFDGVPPASDFIGSFSLQDSASTRYFQQLMSWGGNASTVDAFSLQYGAFGEFGGTLQFLSAGAAWENLELNRWYRQRTVWDFDERRILEVSITDLTTGIETTAQPQGWYLAGGAASTLPLPTEIRLFAGGSIAGNISAWDNISIAPLTACYANCDGSTNEPILTVDDFTCFINEFAAAQSLPHEQQVAHYANCDGSTTAPALTVDDFTCFINAFAAGCP